LTERSPAAALEALRRLQAVGDPVALIIAEQWLPGITGVDLLTQAHQLHPSARRLLLMAVMDRSAMRPLSRR
jgi:thioredoxin reductase (NADPH)